MELKDYIKILSKYLWLIILMALIIGSLCYYFASKKKIDYSGYKSMVVIRNTNGVKSNSYDYDGYYSSGAAALQAKSLSSWLSASSTILSILNENNQKTDASTDKEIKSLIQVKNDLDSAVIVVSSQDQDRNVLDARLIAVGNSAKKYLSTIDNGAYDLKIGDNTITENTVPVKNNTLVGIFSGLILGILFAFGIEYFKQNK